MLKHIKFLLLLFIIPSFYAQNTVNDYQYIIVQQRFDFLKSSDQFQTSSLTKFLFEKKGFTVFLSEEALPNSIQENRCMALNASVTDNSSMFTVKNSIVLKDCYGKVLFTSEEGRSKEKDFKKSYHKAIRAAFDTMTDIEYNPTAKETTAVVTEKKVSVVLPIKKTTKVLTEMVAIDDKKTETLTKKDIEVSNTLYAQQINNGYQLVNTQPVVVFKILKTSLNDVFVIENKNGVFYKENDIWIASYYENNILVVKKFQVKF
ncbi:hypothetical protein [uncultured Polaribacter sp.]|uniref:hypothetical protein n=1 Tax=uncultured Polaribacter sp. TaxID=174711 RepID=UPI002621F976|nr:hypothetical protein [uncultured Polaribacter sp.]